MMVERRNAARLLLFLLLSTTTAGFGHLSLPAFFSSSRNLSRTARAAVELTGGAAASSSTTDDPPDAVYPAKGEDSKSLLAKYHKEYQRSIDDPNAFWGEQAKKYLDWDQPFASVLQGSLAKGDVSWFAHGKLNVAYNAIDRHVFAGRGDDIAILWEGDEPSNVQEITYAELQAKVSQIANALLSQGVRKGDVVTVYMPMIPELPMTLLACARIGAVHSVVFAGFSSEALAQRIAAAQSRFVVTADQGVRGSKSIPLKDIFNKARTKEGCEDLIERVFVWERYYDESAYEAPYTMEPKDVRMNPLVAKQRPYCPCVSMDAEDPLFILYTSGSTGQPKGLVHTTAGYALYAAFTTQTTFDLQPGDRFACVADCGWITGHSYVVYGPLLNGATTFVFESTPVYPDAGRYWDLVQRHQLTHLYTAPTAIRLLMKFGDAIVNQYDLSSLRVLGSVGEPINPQAWKWYYEVVGKGRCTIVDTYWQTETGGHIITNLPGVTPMKPGSCTLPMYGIQPVVLDAVSGEKLDESKLPLEGVLAVGQPWPGMARTCLGDHERYMNVYLKPYPGYYFTGDAVLKDEDGYHFITGRVDDVLSVSGHRIGTAEVESALVAHPAVAQAAVVGKPHPIKGQAISGFVMLTEEAVAKAQEDAELTKELRNFVRSEIGPFAAPDELFISPSLPMTRSGKIMRRILRKIVSGEKDTLGDTSTLSDPSIVDTLIEKVESSEKKK